VVVDDGSPFDVAGRLAGRPRVRALREENAGPAAARNTGIAHSRGRFLVFLDADDHLLPQALEVGLEVLAARPECGFAVGAREEMTFEGATVPWTIGTPPLESSIYRSLLGFDWYIIPPSSAMFRREVVEAIGGFRDPWGADDLDFYLRVAHKFQAACHQATPVTRYRRYSSSSSRDGERMLNSIRVVYDRQRPIVEGHETLQAAFDRGLHRLTDIFIDCVVENIQDRIAASHRAAALRSARVLVRENPARWRALVASGGRDLAELAASLEDHSAGADAITT
jgi:glycosyltransferase involved in cell wall biosynthesis